MFSKAGMWYVSSISNYEGLMERDDPNKLDRWILVRERRDLH
jgi:hypothetical protein